MKELIQKKWRQLLWNVISVKYVVEGLENVAYQRTKEMKKTEISNLKK